MRTWRFVNDDCRAAGTCVCGFCKRDGDCNYGDCRRPARDRCPIFHYPVCERHATANGVRRGGRIVRA